jgi:hypothetical protein
VNVAEEEEEEDEGEDKEFLEMEENPLNDLQVFEAALKVDSELDVNEEELDQLYILPPVARFEAVDSSDL